MQEHTEKIKAYLEGFRPQKFTGGVKMAFEKGNPKTFWRSTTPSFECKKPVGEGFSIDKLLAMATAGTFSGTLLFLFEDGETTHSDYIETYQGRELLELLDNNYRAKTAAPRSPEKRPAVVLRKKA